MREYDKSGAAQISAVFGTLYYVDSPTEFWNYSESS